MSAVRAQTFDVAAGKTQRRLDMALQAGFGVVHCRLRSFHYNGVSAYKRRLAFNITVKFSCNVKICLL